MTISEILYNARIKKGWTTRFVADFIGVSHSAISSWENEKNAIPFAKVDALLKLYDISHTIGVDIVVK